MRTSRKSCLAERSSGCACACRTARYGGPGRDGAARERGTLLEVTRTLPEKRLLPGHARSASRARGAAHPRAADAGLELYRGGRRPKRTAQALATAPLLPTLDACSPACRPSRRARVGSVQRRVGAPPALPGVAQPARPERRAASSGCCATAPRRCCVVPPSAPRARARRDSHRSTPRLAPRYDGRGVEPAAHICPPRRRFLDIQPHGAARGRSRHAAFGTCSMPARRRWRCTASTCARSSDSATRRPNWKGTGAARAQPARAGHVECRFMKWDCAGQRCSKTRRTRGPDLDAHGAEPVLIVRDACT